VFVFNDILELNNGHDVTREKDSYSCTRRA
jgi:hypothetical protein